MQVIHSGAYARIFKRIIDHELFAIKTFSNTQELIDEDFVREVDAMKTCNHQNVMKLVSYSIDTILKSYSIMMRMGNRDLYVHIRDGYVQDPKKILSGIASGLLHLERNGILHGDLKPHNVIIYDDEVPVICDFGLHLRYSHRQTTKREMSTLLWKSPEEQLFPFDDTIVRDFKTISWTFGVITHNVLTETVGIFCSMKEFCDTFGSPHAYHPLYKYLENIDPDIPCSLNVGDEQANDLIHKCVTWNKMSRLSIEEICRHPYINIKLPIHFEEFIEYPKINDKEYSLFLRDLKRFYSTIPQEVVVLALSIYIRYNKKYNILVLVSCISLASKSLLDDSYITSASLYNSQVILEIEKDIIMSLRGRLIAPNCLSRETNKERHKEIIKRVFEGNQQDVHSKI